MRRSDRVGPAGEFAWKTLACIMLVNGSLGVFAPRVLVRGLGVKPELQPGMIYAFRMFGVRTLFIAIDLFRFPGDRERSLREGVAVHATDAGAALTAAALGQLPARPALLVTGLSTINTILAIIGARAYKRGRS
jgi:hypothetical protein